MMTRRRVVAACGGALLAVAAGIGPLGSSPLGAEAPTRLTDQEFWKIASDSSEPDGTFHSENLVSNELRFQSVVRPS